MAAEVKPPVLTIGPLAWLRKNLFSTWYNIVLTLLCHLATLCASRNGHQWAPQKHAGV